MDTIFLALRVLLSLAVVLAAIWYAHRRLTRGGRAPRAAKTVTVVAKQSVGSKASVVVMDVDGQRFLLGVTEQSVSVLNASATPVAEPAPMPAHQLAPVEPPPVRVVPRPTGGAAFARVLSDLQAEAPASDHAAPLAFLPEPRAGALDGSILSAATWKRTAAALRRAR